MSQTSIDGMNAEMIELQEKLLKLANLQADIFLRQVDAVLKHQQRRYLPWQVWTAGMAAGAALLGAAIAIGHWL